MVELVDRLDVTGRRHVVLAAPGDRRDEDIAEIAGCAAGHFDRYILRRDDSLRGRQPDEVPTLLAETLAAAGVEAKRIEIIPDEARATQAALAGAGAGDLVLVFGDDIGRTWRQITEFQPDCEPGDVEPSAVAAPVSASVASTLPPVEVGGEAFVHDERGVHLPRDVEVSD